MCACVHERVHVYIHMCVYIQIYTYIFSHALFICLFVCYIFIVEFVQASITKLIFSHSALKLDLEGKEKVFRNVFYIF